MKNNEEDKLILFKDLFHRDLNKSSKINWNSKSMNIGDYDTILKIDYKINKHGYRGDNFLEKKDILILGCSQTFGNGIPEEFIWPNIFAKKINKDYHSLATKADSLQGQVYKAFQYFKEFGNPKTIVGIFPHSRMEIPYLPGISQKIFDTGDNSHDNDFPMIQKAIFNSHKKLKKFSKLPHHPYDVISAEFAIFYNFMFIEILDQYCKANKINLIWSFYDQDYLRDFIPEIIKTIDSYVDCYKISNFFYPCNMNDNKEIIKIFCHDEFKDHPLFFHASDCNHNTRSVGHWGIHTHQHVADFFHKEYIKIEMNK